MPKIMLAQSAKAYFQCYVQRLFSVVLLEENTARNPEFDYDRFE